MLYPFLENDSTVPQALGDTAKTIKMAFDSMAQNPVHTSPPSGQIVLLNGISKLISNKDLFIIPVLTAIMVAAATYLVTILYESKKHKTRIEVTEGIESVLDFISRIIFHCNYLLSERHISSVKYTDSIVDWGRAFYNIKKYFIVEPNLSISSRRRSQNKDIYKYDYSDYHLYAILYRASLTLELALKKALSKQQIIDIKEPGNKHLKDCIDATKMIAVILQFNLRAVREFLEYRNRIIRLFWKTRRLKKEWKEAREIVSQVFEDIDTSDKKTKNVLSILDLKQKYSQYL